MATSGENGLGALTSLALDYQNSTDEESDIEISAIPPQQLANEVILNGKENLTEVTQVENELVLNESHNQSQEKEKEDNSVPMEQQEIVATKQSSLLNNDELKAIQFSTLAKTVCNKQSADFEGITYEMMRVKEEPSSSSDSDPDDLFVLSSSDESDESDLSDKESNSDEEIKKKKKKKKKKKEPPKAKGELAFEDLPPIEDLQISVTKDECQAIGTIRSFVDPLVVVESYPGLPVLNLDTVLFIDEGDKALGHIFDVIGPVRQPHYCVRFNSKDHMEKRGVEIGMIVYCAPETPHTSFVFVAQLEKLKGSDASWKDDHEPPPEELEVSDDELDKKTKKQRKRPLKAKKNLQPTGYVPRPVAGFMPRGPPRPPMYNNMGRQSYGQYLYPGPMPYGQMPQNYQHPNMYGQHQYYNAYPPMYQRQPPYMDPTIPRMGDNRPRHPYGPRPPPSNYQ